MFGGIMMEEPVKKLVDDVPWWLPDPANPAVPDPWDKDEEEETEKEEGEGEDDEEDEDEEASGEDQDEEDEEASDQSGAPQRRQRAVPA